MQIKFKKLKKQNFKTLLNNAIFCLQLTKMFISLYSKNKNVQHV